ncbi:uncharacterized protein [Elaeis guineensis]|uniref:Uncharacterized protein LOC114912884 n=1 Tax=Elaeis guineensis var. tenera TaxID=51953 RepID=A0A8N4F0H6_ELAGV|nr:uncharacterized protein LOC114912884 [Elaeis guineensis]
MAMASEQQVMPKGTEEGAKGIEGLPPESSPYVKYSDLEDYKQQGYGTHGHLPTIDTSRHGGATDAPTLSGAGLSEGQVRTLDPVDRQSTV